jgi:hypothetical protein
MDDREYTTSGSVRNELPIERSSALGASTEQLAEANNAAAETKIRLAD